MLPLRTNGAWKSMLNKTYVALGIFLGFSSNYRELRNMIMESAARKTCYRARYFLHNEYVDAEIIDGSFYSRFSEGFNSDP